MNYKIITVVITILFVLFLSLSSVSAFDNQNQDFKITNILDFDIDNTTDTYGIIGALDSEITVLKNELNDIKEYDINGIPVYVGTIGNHKVILMKCGMGKVSAASGAQHIIDKFNPDYIINTGCAGALQDNISVGDVVIANYVVQHDLDTVDIGNPIGYVDALGVVEIQADKKLSDKLVDSIKEDNITPLRGMIVSGDQFISTDEQREEILSNFPNALCAEMEGAAIGQVCAENNVPFSVIRCISEDTKGDNNVEYESFQKTAGEKSASWVIKMLLNN